jgi:hypothetical protein
MSIFCFISLHVYKYHTYHIEKEICYQTIAEFPFLSNEHQQMQHQNENKKFNMMTWHNTSLFSDRSIDLLPYVIRQKQRAMVGQWNDDMCRDSIHHK